MKISKAFAEQVAIRLPRQTLTRYAIYNTSKQVAKWIGIKLTKDTFARGVSKVIPLIGVPIPPGLPYWTFKAMVIRLKKSLDE